jgi:GT2 family glycosyltransferase
MSDAVSGESSTPGRGDAFEANEARPGPCPAASGEPSKPVRGDSFKSGSTLSGTYPAVSGGTYPAVSGGTYPAVSGGTYPAVSGGVLRLSVIIPTFNRSGLLKRLLQALGSQSVGPEFFEVVVVDDGSSDDTQQMLQDYAKEFPASWLRVFRQKNRGPAAARNLAIKEAQADWIAMTDDDTVPCSDWVEQILVAIQRHPFWVGIEGRTVCPDPNPMGHWVESLRGGSYITANMAYRRDLLEQIGGFDDSFPFPKCEDTEIAWRALQDVRALTAR